MLKQHDHVTLVRIGQSNSKFEMEIFIERDDKAIFQVRTRVVYDRVRKRKYYFEMFLFMFSFDVLNFPALDFPCSI